MIEPAPVIRAANLPEALIREQSLKQPAQPAPAPVPAAAPTQPEKHPLPVMTPIVVKAMDETPVRDKPAQPVAEQKPAAPANTSAPKVTEPSLKIKVKTSSPIETIEDSSRGNKIKVRIFKGPTTLPIPNFENCDDETDGELRALFLRVKQSFKAMPIEPPSPKRRIQKVAS